MILGIWFSWRSEMAGIDKSSLYVGGATYIYIFLGGRDLLGSWEGIKQVPMYDY